MLNEECVAEDYILMEEFQAGEQYTLAETTESGLCEHCMGVVDRLRMFFERGARRPERLPPPKTPPPRCRLYQFPSRLTNFKRAVVHVRPRARTSRSKTRSMLERSRKWTSRAQTRRSVVEDGDATVRRENRRPRTSVRVGLHAVEHRGQGPR